MRTVHRKTVVDNLAALAAFRRLGGVLAAARAPFILLKGIAYLDDLYDDAGSRALTDVDLLIRREDAGRVARRLAADGFQGETGPSYPENRRFEMWLPDAAACRFEFHWALGLPHRFALDDTAIRERSAPATLEGVECRRCAREDALLYHVAHLADHYFGPSLKWILDLREMFRRWSPDLRVLADRSAAWRTRTALHLALRHLEKLFPGEGQPDLAARVAPGPLRRRLLGAYLSRAPLAMLAVGVDDRRRYPLRCLMLDRPGDAVALALGALTRPILGAIGFAPRPAAPPWEWSD